MSDLHSIWLMPSAGDAATLRSITDELRGNFSSPWFQPHLTLVEEVERDLDDLAKLCRRIAERHDCFTIAIEGVGTSKLYFRSFYVRFPADGPVAQLRESAIAAISPEHTTPFLPHVSLLYGIAETARKEEARRTLEVRIAGQSICFDRICVVASAKTIPIDRWAIVSTFALGCAIDMDPADGADETQA